MIKKYNEYIKESTSFHNLHGDDEYDITKVTRDDGHDYRRCDGVMYELSLSGNDEIVNIHEIEHTDENQFYQDQIDRYVEYIQEDGIIESFPVDKSALGSANNLESMCEYLGEGDNFDLMWEILHKEHEELYDIIEKLLYDSESYGIDSSILSSITNIEELEEFYGDDYNSVYEDDEEMYWKEEYYLGFHTILEYWSENSEYTLTDMNHRFAALKEMGKSKVYIDLS